MAYYAHSQACCAASPRGARAPPSVLSAPTPLTSSLAQEEVGGGEP